MKINGFALVTFGLLILMSTSVIVTKNLVSSFFFVMIVSLFINWEHLKLTK